MARRLLDIHRFWRDPALPQLEAREVRDGRAISYAPHSHPTFSIGVVTGGRSEYRIGGAQHEISAGAVVLMNPDEVHACNPLHGLPWSYRMLYVDAGWLAGVEGQPHFRPFGLPLSRCPALYRDLDRLFDLLFDDRLEKGAKERAAAAFFAGLRQRVSGSDAAEAADHGALARAAAFISANCTQPLPLEEVCAAAGLSRSYLVRAFKARYGLTPHAYQVNRRVQLGQRELRRGRPIAEAALAAGFADQAHFQRAFKRHLAATPGQYAGAVRSGGNANE